MTFTNQKFNFTIILSLLFILLFVASTPQESKQNYECSAFKVQTSSYMHIRVNQKIMHAKTNSTFKNIAAQDLIQTQLLPPGFVPVGGGGNQVIACKILK